MKIRTTLFSVGLAAATIPAVLSGPAATAHGAGGTVDGEGASVEWTGTAPVSRTVVGCQHPADPGCNNYALTVDFDDADHQTGTYLEVEIVVESTDDLDVTVFDPAGNAIASGAESGTTETVTIADPINGTYTVGVYGFLNNVGSLGEYTASATVDRVGGDAPGTPPQGGLFVDDIAVGGCLQAAPAHVSHSLIDGGERVSLDVLMVLDDVHLFEVAEGLPTAQARQVAEDHLRNVVVPKASQSYNGLDIDFNVVDYVHTDEVGVTFRSASLGTVRDFNGGTRPGIYAAELFEQLKASFLTYAENGWEGNEVDLVFVVSGKDLFSAPDGTDDGQGLLGQADCIGGVRNAVNSFGIGESWSDRIGGLPAQNNAAALVLAHEVGHLMGAHHHYGDCATGQNPTHEANERVEPTHPCTLMFPSAGPNNMPFSGLNSVIVRGHAVDNA